MHIAVLGGGLGGAATAMRLAKMGHQVTLCEATGRIGGAIGTIESGDFRWDSGPGSTLLPAVLRDLFRKSGRPLERELDLVPTDTTRHFFPKKSKVGDPIDLPHADRAEQLHALEQVKKGLGDQWCAYVEQFAEDWEALRKDFYEHPYAPTLASKHTQKLLSSRLSLYKLVQRRLKDPRLQQIALAPALISGQSPRLQPAWLGLDSYLEQNFGRWTSPAGMGALADALAQRLETRKVEVLLNAPAHDIEIKNGRATGVLLKDQTLEADAVVCGIDPRRLPSLTHLTKQSLPAIPPVVLHLGLRGDIPPIPHEVMIHTDPLIRIRRESPADSDVQSWTVSARGRIGQDLVDMISEVTDLNISPLVQARVPRSPKDMIVQWGQSPLGNAWRGRASLKTILSTSGGGYGYENLFFVGTHSFPGSQLHEVGLSASLASQLIGPAV